MALRLAVLGEARPPGEHPVASASSRSSNASIAAMVFGGAPVGRPLTLTTNTLAPIRQRLPNLSGRTFWHAGCERSDSEDIAGSDDFIVAVARAQRVAGKTESSDKSRRLAAAVENCGSWAPFSVSEREQFTRLVEDFDLLHVWLLHYFRTLPGYALRKIRRHSTTVPCDPV